MHTSGLLSQYRPGAGAESDLWANDVDAAKKDRNKVDFILK